ncbi:lantibiotic dehydratase [Streptomyces yaizuensis]|uniref:Lantibiotic dehydratase n=1 Tax=Streptomyces yaizuensis TaxID=2989713 RepID=A0ABQ5P270_9ACTN|nr:lantibiotic dehydratase [Streptomyces sp. YSPA8]GLF96708.1 lantibiotic dehydratase [Streptomyces sp. YSPA8]
MSSPGIRFAGYGVVRVCSQPAGVVDRLSSREVARLCDELEQVRREWHDRAPRVAEELTALVPLLDDRAERRTVLAVRRRLHRALDVPAADLEQLRPLRERLGGQAGEQVDGQVGEQVGERLRCTGGTGADTTATGPDALRCTGAAGTDGPGTAHGTDRSDRSGGVGALSALATRRDDLAARLTAAYEEARRAEQTVLAAAALDPALRAGAQLSANGLLHNMDRYAAAVTDGDVRGKRDLMTESTVIHLLTRSALKPSPFGQLVHTRPVLLDTGPAAPGARHASEPSEPSQASEASDPSQASGGTRSSVCRLPRQLVSWVERCLAALPALRATAVLRRAPVVAASAQRTVFLVRGRDGTDEPAAKERFVPVPPHPVVTELLALPADAALPEPGLRARCAALEGVGQEAADTLLDSLIAQGVLARDLGVGDQDPHPVARLAALLPPDLDAGVRECVTALAAAEAAFATAGLDHRQQLIARIERQVTDFAGRCGVTTPPIDAARTLVYEDAVIATPRAEDPGRWRRHLPALAHWHRLLPVFDDGAHVRAIVADVVRTHFGPGPHRLLPLYAAMSSPKLQPVLAQRLTDLTAPVPSRLRALQDEVFDLAGPPGGDDGAEAVIDPRRAAAIADTLPPWIPRWDRASWNVQHHGTTSDGGLLVVNGGAIGFGRAISRFLPAYEAAGERGFGELVRADIAAGDRGSAPLTDLSAVLGINANVHSALLGSHLRYPCTAGGAWGGDTGVSLEDCWAAFDEDTGLLVLRRGKDGPALRLVMLNFLLNELAPRCYQFLNFFGSGGLANLAWWDRVDQRRGARDKIRRYPRVRSDGLVLARATWKIPADRLPDASGRDDLAFFTEVRRWREALGLPERVFYRGFTLPDPLVPVSEEERRTWTRTLARFPTSAERKPTYLDFTSLTAVRAWQRVLRRWQGELTFQECVPDVPGAAPVGHPGGFTEEFIIETTEGAR